MKRLIQYILRASTEELAQCTLQDIAICLTWYESGRRNPDFVQKWKAVPQIAENWALMHGAETAATEGRRNQWLLRDLIDAVHENGCANLRWDELEFISNIYEYAGKAAGGTLYARPRQLLEPCMPDVAARKATLHPARDLPGLSARLTVVNDDDIQSAKPREIKVFAGIEMPSIGPVLVLKGHVKVLCAIPENCTLVVENGSCSVEGFLFGKLAARYHCDVRDNICGVAIVRQGDIRARKIIDNAYVVSKNGRVMCRQTQNPAMVYGASEVHIREDAFLGKYISPRIIIEGKARGGIYQATRLIRAGQFTGGGSTEPPRIVLREEITCVDYGEKPDEEAVVLMRKARAIQRRLSSHRALAKQADADVEGLAGTAVYHLCTSEEAEARLARIAQARRRLAILKRLVEGLRSIAIAAADSIEDPKAALGDELGESSLSPFADVAAELHELAGDDAVDVDLATALEDMASLKKKLDNIGPDKRHVTTVLLRIRTQIDQYTIEATRLAKAIGQAEHELERITSGVLGRNDPQRQRSMVRVLRQLIRKSQEDLTAEALHKKMGNSFFQLIMRKLQTRVANAQRYRDSIQELSREYNDLAEILRKNYNITIAQTGSGGDEKGAEAIGLFSAGVRLFTDVFLMDVADPPPGAVVITNDSQGNEHVYTRSIGGVVTLLEPSNQPPTDPDTAAILRNQSS